MAPELVIPIVHIMDNFVGPLADLPYTVSTLIEGQISLNRIRPYIFRPQHLQASSKRPPSRGLPDSSHDTEEKPLLTEHRAREAGETQRHREQASDLIKNLHDVAQKMLQYELSCPRAK